MSDAVLDDLLTLARLSLAGRQQDVFAFLQRTARRYQRSLPEGAERIIELLRENPSRSSPLRDSSVPLPVDFDSRQQLVRIEHPAPLDVEPILAPEVERTINQIVLEHGKKDELARAGLAPSRAVLFVGEPGV
jgi:hypothetical protein